MSFNTALTGLNAATADLNVKSNNIANVNTTGFKGSRAEFADVYAVSAFGSSNTAIGSGVVLNNVAQQFEQGNLEFTDNSLDLAISGQGFFALAPSQSSGEVIYTRAGAFGIDSDGFVVNSSGQFLRTFPVNSDGTVSSTSMSSTTPLQLPSAAGVPQATANVDLAANLPSTAADIAAATAIDPTDPTTYTNSTSVTVYDSLGNEHIVTLYYQKTDAASNQWNVDAYINEPDGLGASQTQLGTTKVLDFDPLTGGSLSTTPSDQTYSITSLDSGAATPQAIVIDYAGTTQNSGGFTVTSLTQDGFTTGRLSGLDISSDGLVKATYTNGQSTPLGKIALANFPNPQGLKQIGNTAWRETIDSGEVLAGEAGTGSFGLIQSGALEASNIDLTKELVGLITAQRNFQANSKAIETNNAITQTIINLR
ncbi:flagellar hook protein FlgE [Methylophaga sp. OBS4]|uniref:flagellar hook protein FlgE n=1 Tax=Methylophaga sp. OBS4 TaxID=2991935 RepID=UPI0022517EFA|nr:flagellar hook protein FlgE [Methylophaga sp. OBS4]MCX4187354.1 flagellar hook protein FlgE [Methylophaga sp. OBS4]